MDKEARRIRKAVEALGDRADFGAVTDAVKTAAFKITRAGELLGRLAVDVPHARNGHGQKAGRRARGAVHLPLLHDGAPDGLGVGAVPFAGQHAYPDCRNVRHVRHLDLVGFDHAPPRARCRWNQESHPLPWAGNLVRPPAEW